MPTPSPSRRLPQRQFCPQAPSPAFRPHFGPLRASQGLDQPPLIFRCVFGIAPAYGPTPDVFPPGDEAPGDEAPGDESDAIDALGDEIATLAAHIHAATHRLLVLLAERAMAAGFGAEPSGAPGDEAAPISGTRAARYQVVLHMEAVTLREEGGALSEEAVTLSQDRKAGGEVADASGRSDLEDGTRVHLASLDQLAERRTDALRASPVWPLVSAETSRRISCDAALVRITHAPDGSLLDMSRRTRTVPPAGRRASPIPPFSVDTTTASSTKADGV